MQQAFAAAASPGISLPSPSSAVLLQATGGTTASAALHSSSSFSAVSSTWSVGVGASPSPSPHIVSPSPSLPSSAVTAAASRSSHSSSSGPPSHAGGPGAFSRSASTATAPRHRHSQHEQPHQQQSAGAAAPAPAPAPALPPQPPRAAAVHHSRVTIAPSGQDSHTHLAPPPIGGEDVSAIVVDLGSTVLRVGHAQEDCPRQVLPACALAPLPATTSYYWPGESRSSSSSSTSSNSSNQVAEPTHSSSTYSQTLINAASTDIHQQEDFLRVRRRPGKGQQYCGRVSTCCCCRAAAAHWQQQQNQQQHSSKSASKHEDSTTVPATAIRDEYVGGGGNRNAATAAGGGMNGYTNSALADEQDRSEKLLMPDTEAIKTDISVKQQQHQEDEDGTSATIQTSTLCCCACGCWPQQMQQSQLVVPIDLYDYEKACRYTFRRCLSYCPPPPPSNRLSPASAAVEAAGVAVSRVAAAAASRAAANRAASTTYFRDGEQYVATHYKASLVAHHLPGASLPPSIINVGGGSVDSQLQYHPSETDSNASSNRSCWQFDIDVFKALLFSAVQGTAVPERLLGKRRCISSGNNAAAEKISMPGAVATTGNRCTCCCSAFTDTSASGTFQTGGSASSDASTQVLNSSQINGVSTAHASSSTATDELSAAVEIARAAATAALETAEASKTSFPEPFRSAATGGLGVFLQEHPLLLVEPTIHDAAWREKTAELVFNELHVPAAAWAKRGAVAAFAFGRSTALVVHVGAAGTTVGPVYEGFCLQKNTRFYPVGGDFLDLQIATYIRRLRLQQQQQQGEQTSWQQRQHANSDRGAYHADENKMQHTKEEESEMGQQDDLEQQRQQKTGVCGGGGATQEPETNSSIKMMGSLHAGCSGGSASTMGHGASSTQELESMTDAEVAQEGLGGLVLPSFGYRAVPMPRGEAQQEEDEEETSSRRNSPRDNSFLQQLQQQHLRGGSTGVNRGFEEGGGPGRLLPIMGWKVVKREPLLAESQQQGEYKSRSSSNSSRSRSMRSAREGRKCNTAMLRAGTHEVVRILKESVCRVLLLEDDDEDQDEDVGDTQQHQGATDGGRGSSKGDSSGSGAGTGGGGGNSSSKKSGTEAKRKSGTATTSGTQKSSMQHQQQQHEQRATAANCSSSAETQGGEKDVTMQEQSGGGDTGKGAAAPRKTRPASEAKISADETVDASLEGDDQTRPINSGSSSSINIKGSKNMQTASTTHIPDSTIASISAASAAATGDSASLPHDRKLQMRGTEHTAVSGSSNDSSSVTQSYGELNSQEKRSTTHTNDDSHQTETSGRGNNNRSATAVHGDENAKVSAEESSTTSGHRRAPHGRTSTVSRVGGPHTCCCGFAARNRGATGAAAGGKSKGGGGGGGGGGAATATKCWCYELPDGTLVNTEPLQYTIGEILFRPVAALQQLKASVKQAAGPGSTPTVTATADAKTTGEHHPIPSGGPEQHHATLTPQELHALGGFEGITKAIESCIESCDVDVRRELLSSIILTGGTSLMPGFVQRVAAELQSPHFAYSSAPCLRLRVIAPNSSVERRFSSWLGGSLLASLGTFQQQWISREEYLKYGMDVINKRCY